MYNMLNVTPFGGTVRLTREYPRKNTRAQNNPRKNAHAQNNPRKNAHAQNNLR